MSRSVRIRGDIAAQIEGLADRERRPFANAVEVLLLAALAERDVDVNDFAAIKESLMPGGVVPSGVHDVPMRPHMRKDRPALECKERVSAGTVCSECGRLV